MGNRIPADKQKVTIKLPADVHPQMQAIAESNGVPFETVYTTAITDWLALQEGNLRPYKLGNRAHHDALEAILNGEDPEAAAAVLAVLGLALRPKGDPK